MDSQNNPNPGATRSEDDTNATPEVSVDLAAQQSSAVNPTDVAADPSAQAPYDQQVAPQPQVGDQQITEDVPHPDAAIAFTTDSNGTVQAVPATEVTQQNPEAPVDASFVQHDPVADAGSVAVSSETTSADPSVQPAPAVNPQFSPTDQPVVAPAPTDPNQPIAAPPLDGSQGGIPPVAPVPVPAKDKKLIVILGVVAVVLLAAIAVLVVL
jgi:hypothetical protein